MIGTKEISINVNLNSSDVSDSIHSKIKYYINLELSNNASVIYPISIKSISDGSINENMIRYKVVLDVMYLSLDENEIIDAEIVSLSRQGISCKYGPYMIFISSDGSIPEELLYYQSNEISLYKSKCNSIKMMVNDKIRLRVLYIRDFFCLGTVNEDYLGSLGEEYIR